MEYEDFEVIDLGLTDKQRDRIVHEAVQCVGKWYDYVQILGYVFSPNTFWGSPNALICSELAHELYKIIQIHIGDRFTKPNELYKLVIEYKQSCA
jgi:hypothetical protein